MAFSRYVAAAPPGEIAALALVLGLAILATFAAAFVFLRRTRLLEDLPTSRVRSAAQGYVEFEGVARLMDGEPVVCPLTATRCAWWRYRVEAKARRGDRDACWQAVEAATSDACFLLDDGTGACIVDPAGASVIPSVSRTWYGYAARPDVGFEQGRGWWRALWCTHRYTEELIPGASRLYAVGAFRTQAALAGAPDEEADLRDVLQKWRADPAMMKLLDVNRDGVVDQTEWEAARRAAREQVRRERVREAVQTPDLDILARPRDGRPFVLSGIPQAELVLRYRSRAAACIGACTLFVGLALLALRARGVIG